MDQKIIEHKAQCVEKYRGAVDSFFKSVEQEILRAIQDRKDSITLDVPSIEFYLIVEPILTMQYGYKVSKYIDKFKAGPPLEINISF